MPHHAKASSAYVVDEADITDPDVIQNENWFAGSDQGTRLFVTNVAWQPIERTEITFAETHYFAEQTLDLITPQLKYVWHEATKKERWSSSIVIGLDVTVQKSGLSDAYLYVPVSFSATNAISINANLGMVDAMEEHRQIASWGLGTEIECNRHWTAVAEFFGRSEGKAGVQFGPRLTLDSIILDAIAGQDIDGNNGNWMTLGLTANF